MKYVILCGKYVLEKYPRNVRCILCGSAEGRFSFRGVCFEHAVYYVLDFCSVPFDRQFLLVDLLTWKGM